MKFQNHTTRVLSPTTPFDFDSTFHKPDHFTSGDNLWEPDIRWQTWFWRDRQLGLKFINTGEIEDPEITLEVYGRNAMDEVFLSSLEEEVRYRFNLGLDLTDFNASFADDEVLGSIIDRWRGMRPGHPSSLYEYLIIGIVLQNATVKRSLQMFQTLLENFGTKLVFDDKVLWCFWSSGGLADVDEQELRELKVGYRAKSIKHIDELFGKGLIDEFKLREKDLESQKETLLDLYGVGPATVGYLLFDVFHHWGYFDHISPWEQKIYSKLFFDTDPEEPVSEEKLLGHFDRFGDYKQLAVHYIWEDLWWRRKNESVPWLEKLIRC